MSIRNLSMSTSGAVGLLGAVEVTDVAEAGVARICSCTCTARIVQHSTSLWSHFSSTIHMI